jgi:phosphohistidine phosphatase SixA
MQAGMRKLALALLLLLPMPAQAAAEIVDALRQGGLVVFLRHAETGPPWPDHVGAALGDCATQRNLNEAGRAQSLAIGRAMQALGVPVGAVLASPFCRTMETAELAFGTATAEMRLSLPRHLDAAAHRAMGEALLELVATARPAAGNLVLVGHSYHLIAAGGPRPDPQGAAAVLRPRPEGGFETMALLAPQDWMALAWPRLAEARP